MLIRRGATTFAATAGLVAALIVSAAPAHAVLGGAAAAEGAYPFVVSVDAGERGCSGVLVQASLILTAKDCFGDLPAEPGPPPTATFATVGRTDLTQNTGVRVVVAELIPHPELNAVLGRLASPVEGIAPVAIGAPATAGETVRVAGYGRTATEWVPDNLHVADVTVAAVTDGGFTVAAGDGEVTTCKGDAGGPALRAVAGGGFELVGVHDSSYQGGCFGGTGDRRDAVETRADRLTGWIRRLAAVPDPVAEVSNNLAADATFTASSSAPESWGWSLRTINDGFRDRNGWSSWSQTDVDHTEWVELAFPEAREVGRVDLYPRVDVPGGSFPANFTISTWTGSAWETALTKQNFPNPGITAVRLSFPLKATSKVRIEGTRLRLMQLSEIEAYRSQNLAAEATFTASSSAPESWGWGLSHLNDGYRERTGWSSWSQTDVDHTEWLELAFPAARQVNRIELYPRADVPGGSFPANFTISAWTGTAWETVVTKRNLPNPGATPVRLTFAPRTTTKLRLEATAVKLVQFNEVAAYNLFPSPAVTAPASLPSVVEPRDYPGAAEILQTRGIKLFKGDGHVTLVDCGVNPNNPPADLILVQTYDLTLPGGSDFCFRGRGPTGFLTMEINKAYTIRGDNTHTVAATVETADDQTVVETEQVDPREWQPVGIGQNRGDAKILELRFPHTS